MYIVFECRKCGHELYMDAYNIGWKHFKKLAERIALSVARMDM